MAGFHKVSMTVAAAGNKQFMPVAEVSQQPAVLRPVSGVIAFKAIQFFVDQPGQIFLHASTVKIAGQMCAKGNPSSLPDYLYHF